MTRHYFTGKGVPMYSTIGLLAAAGLLVASSASAQSPERALLNRIPTGHSAAGTFSAALHMPAHAARILDLAGERALLGRVDTRTSMAPASGAHAPVDGTRALLVRWPSQTSIAPRSRASRSSFLALVRGDIVTDAAGAAEFGLVEDDTGRPSGFVVSLGARDGQSAVLFTHNHGAPLGVGRYRITDRANGADEVQALVMTGSATNPSGAFRGQSGWLVVTDASDDLITARFHLDAVGFLASEPEAEDRPVSVSGLFSATAPRS